MATTFRQALNRVLRSVGEDEITSSETELSSDYHKLVALFVNQIKEEIESEHNWRVLRQTLSVVIPAGENTADIVGTNEHSRVYRFQNEECGSYDALCFDLTLPDQPIPLIEMDAAEMIYKDAMDVETSSVEPIFFYTQVNATGDGLALVVYPPPSIDRTIELTMVVPQARLEDDDLDIVIKIPSRVLELGTIWYALEERGEELGANALYTEERYRKALTSAVSLDAEEQGGYQLVVT